MHRVKRWFFVFVLGSPFQSCELLIDLTLAFLGFYAEKAVWA